MSALEEWMVEAATKIATRASNLGEPINQPTAHRWSPKGVVALLADGIVVAAIGEDEFAANSSESAREELLRVRWSEAIAKSSANLRRLAAATCPEMSPEILGLTDPFDHFGHGGDSGESGKPPYAGPDCPQCEHVMIPYPRQERTSLWVCGSCGYIFFRDMTKPHHYSESDEMADRLVGG